MLTQPHLPVPRLAWNPQILTSRVAYTSLVALYLSRSLSGVPSNLIKSDSWFLWITKLMLPLCRPLRSNVDSAGYFLIIWQAHVVALHWSSDLGCCSVVTLYPSHSWQVYTRHLTSLLESTLALPILFLYYCTLWTVNIFTQSGYSLVVWYSL